MGLISAIQYLDIDVERYLVETYLTKDKFSEETMKDTILPYIASLDDVFYKNGFTGNNGLHIDRVDPDRCVSPNLMIERRAEQPEWHKVRGTNPVLTRGIITATNYVSESAKLAKLQFMAKVLSKQIKEYVRVDQIDVPGVNNALGQRRRYPGYDVKWKGMKIKFSRSAFTI
jgi:hypothetical protein